MTNTHDYHPLRSLTVILLLAGITMLGACGKKGGLYLPDEPPPKVQSEAQSITPEDSTESKKSLPKNSKSTIN